MHWARSTRDTIHPVYEIYTSMHTTRNPYEWNNSDRTGHGPCAMFVIDFPKTSPSATRSSIRLCNLNEWRMIKLRSRAYNAVTVAAFFVHRYIIRCFGSRIITACHEYYCTMCRFSSCDNWKCATLFIFCKPAQNNMCEVLSVFPTVAFGLLSYTEIVNHVKDDT